MLGGVKYDKRFLESTLMKQAVRNAPLTRQHVLYNRPVYRYSSQYG